MSGLLDLEVSVPADEWAYAKRRLIYLETLLIRIVRDESRVQEWFSSVEIAAMRLPGLPASPNGVRMRASADNWRRRKASLRRSLATCLPCIQPARARLRYDDCADR